MEEQQVKVGRPEIGPPVSTSIPPEIHRYVIRMAARRRAKKAAIVRSLIIAGYEATRGGSR